MAGLMSNGVVMVTEKVTEEKVPDEEEGILNL